LFAAFTTVFAMLGLNGLPRFSNPVFNNPKFDRTTDDRFFLWVDSSDKYFNSDKVLTVIPLTIVWNIRAVPSGSPRWHVFFDMDFQPFKKAQKQTVIFADGRTERPPVPGTVARGAPPASDPYYLGYEPDPVVAGGVVPSDDMTQLVSAKGTVVEGTAVDPQDPLAGAVDPSSQDPGSAQVAASDGATAAVPDLKWLTTVPSSVALDDSLFELGEQKFNQICAVCHGYAGFGNGLVAKRAEALAATYWLQPTSVHDPRIQEQPVGQVYYTITNGKGKMGGYGSTLSVRERWAVAVYVKALQRSQNAKDSDVPDGKIGN
jgi:mono/diheme cytochrome c family protein